MRRINTLTGIRGLAALWVILFHTYFLSDVHAAALGDFWASLAGRGWLGVDLFFVLSGFVVSYVYLDKMAEFNPSNALDFYMRRLARIYPAHLFVLFLFLLLFFLAHQLGLSFNRDHYAWDRFWTQLVLLNGVGLAVKNGWNYVSWSISAEFAAYLLFPGLAILVARLKARTALFFMILTFLMMFTLALTVNEGKAYFLPWSATLSRVLSEFFLGCLAFKVYQSAILPRIAPYIAPFLFFLIIAVAGISHAPLVDGYLVVLFSLFIPFIAADESSWLARSLQSRSLMYLGEISFSVYLIQNLVEIFVNVGTGRVIFLSQLVASRPMTNFVINAVLSIVAGSLLYHLVERKAQKAVLMRFAARNHQANA